MKQSILLYLIFSSQQQGENNEKDSDDGGDRSHCLRCSCCGAGRFQISVCDGTACHLKGAPLIHEWLNQELNLKPGETAPDGVFSLETVACLGCCSLAPVMSVNGKVHGKLDRKKVMRIIKEYQSK